MIRVGLGAFLVALWTKGGVILTPELQTDSAWVSWLQLGMALALFWRATMALTAFGIVFLWSLGVANYGLFHLLDYPIFLGIAVYGITVDGRQGTVVERPVKTVVPLKLISLAGFIIASYGLQALFYNAPKKSAVGINHDPPVLSHRGRGNGSGQSG